MIPKAPTEITPAIKRLLKKLGNVSPVSVPVKPEPGAAPDDCFPVVERKVQQNGGTAVYGWTIWASPVMVEAEFHAVWQSTSGEFVDLTPKQNGATEIMFVPEPSAKYEGRQVNNVRMPVYRNDVLVERLIKVHDQIYEVMNSHERANQHGQIAIPREEIEPLFRKQQELGGRILDRKVGPNEPCVCGSGRRLKHCCGD